ncbi:family 43 glycosylhydrolase [Flavobacterium gawalongense]|uniref:Family 43 glycosylhydrolase n=1 Tax=Flavobacterium gawalongense TaxID=2594432 RepID=A0A553BSP7_9FLAO|nr:family 43 glycosylhydrolase [Flavobacterium gawalongense]TRX11271.1 family 43 glycosylhydrolase [Flavobacterium gawalongense]TRX12268.1 family 43 glycosylhydrolase [Flavobacterium gawalongense]TRX30193.1 family 43 glycosylhydrolase [Flavobacterium gawalongense]
MNNNFLKIFGLLWLLLVGYEVEAQQNQPLPQPVIPDYVADPSVSYFNGIYYLYGTSDIDHGLQEMGPPVVWISKDLVNWSYKGVLFKGFDWNKPYTFGPEGKKKTGYFRYWAPGVVIKKDKLYHLYPTILKPDNKLGTYHLTSKSPEGPFQFSNGKGIFFNEPEKEKEETKPVFADIDGDPFVDDDGQAYIYWRRRKAAKLSKDWKTIEGSEVSIPTKRSGYSEGPLLFKRNGIYYYLYTLSGGANYVYAYMMSKTGPLGPFVAPEQDMVFKSNIEKGVWGPGHGNVLHIPGTDDYLFFYLEYGQGSTTRQVFVNRLQFNADGTIKPVQVTTTGISEMPNLNKKPLIRPVKVTASSVRRDTIIKTTIDTVIEKLITIPPKFVESELANVQRTMDFKPENAIDASNGTFWMCDNADKKPWYQIDLGAVKRVKSLELFFLKSTLGHSFKIEKSDDGKEWKTVNMPVSQLIRSPEVINKIGKTRFLKLTILSGAPGLWEVKVY